MKKTILAVAALSFALASGAAFAQTNDGNIATDGEAGVSGFMNPFFTDESMSAVRPAEENRTTFMAMAPADQEKLRGDCASIVAQGSAVADDTTASIDPDQLPPAMAQLCEQVGTWQ